MPCPTSTPLLAISTNLAALWRSVKGFQHSNPSSRAHSTAHCGDRRVVWIAGAFSSSRGGFFAVGERASEEKELEDKMQSLSASIPRGKPLASRKEMPKGGGLPLCLSGVSILAQVPQSKAKLCSASSSRCRLSSTSRGSSSSFAARILDVRAALDLNAAESWSRSCNAAERPCEESTTVPLGPCDREANVQRPRFAVAQKMAELDRRRESLRKRRLVQGLGSFLEEQAFMQSRMPQGFVRPLWLELISADLNQGNNNPRHHCGARAA